MPDSSYLLSKPNLAYAKLVATPTDTAWSQVYNAGNLFACVSLVIAEPDGDVSLPSLGKKLLDNLQTEFFTLERKEIEPIKEIMQQSLNDIPENVETDICLALFKENILYLFILGQGRVVMKRRGQIGKLLEGKHEGRHIVTASGYLQNEDTIVLQTKQFVKDITEETFKQAIELALPNDIAEALSPELHERADGGQAAIIVVYHGKGHEQREVVPQEEETIGTSQEQPHHVSDNLHMPESHSETREEDDTYNDEIDENEEDYEEEENKRRRSLSFPKLPSVALVTNLSEKFRIGDFKMSHRRKLFLSIIVILVILLGASIFFTKKKEADAQQRQVFLTIYEPALKKYEDGQALEKLNESLSYDNYVEAKKLLNENSSKFPAGSNEGKQIQELLAKVEAELAGSSPIQSANAKEATVSSNSLLAVAKSNKDGFGFTQDDTAVYFVTNDAIVSVNKSSGQKKDLIKNDNAWSDAVGISTYQGNFYVLDRSKGVVKFVATGEGYSSSGYFKDKPDMSNARDLAIDSSILILQKDGTILKYTSGVSDGFKSPKLEKAIADPVKIFTDANTDNVYILDRGNSRVVKIAKEGSNHTEYSSGVIKSAKDFEVKEKDKKIFILSGDKVYEIAL